MSPRTKRVLIIGRSGSVLRHAVAMLRALGYGANASNQFNRILDDYDVREVDLVVFGGMVPPERKAELRAQIGALHPGVQFLQGLGGIAALIVAQVDEFFGGPATGVEFDATRRAFQLRIRSAENVVLTGLWARFVPPDPVPESMLIFEGALAAGVHTVRIPHGVPQEGSYATVRVGDRVSAFQIGETPPSVKRIAAAQSLPAPEPVTTQFVWSSEA